MDLKKYWEKRKEKRNKDSVTMRHYVPDDEGENLEYIVNLGAKIKEGKEHVQSKYLELDIKVWIQGSEFYEVFYGVDIEGKGKEKLRKAVSDYIKICGIPKRVGGTCNELVDEILQQHGKRVKGRFLSRYFVKNVTDKK